MTEPVGEVLDADQNQWWHKDLVIYADATGAFGTAEGTKASTDRHSPLGKAFGDNQQRATGSFADAKIPIDVFNFVSYATGHWTKQCFRDETWATCPR